MSAPVSSLREHAGHRVAVARSRGLDRPLDPAVAAAVRQGLLRSPKRLPPWLLYDRAGSALFEEITRLPEYYLTRTERAILTRYADTIFEAAGAPPEIIELGAGSASKTRILLEAALAQRGHVRYVPVDVSPAALSQARAGLADLYGLDFAPLVARYPEELGFLAAPSGAPQDRLHARPHHRLVLFLGSNIGNYDARLAHRLLVTLRRHLAPGDALLVGADRPKSWAILRAAYDDAAGITAAFNKNVLAHINRALGANFDLARFKHIVRWNRRASRVELYLESTVSERVAIPALAVTVELAAGERIHTESSYKLPRARLHRLLRGAGFRPEAQWLDTRRWFGLTLSRVPPR